MPRDFYATAAQILPVLMLALLWESRFLDRLRTQRRTLRRHGAGGEVRFWTKPRVRAYSIFISVLIVAGTALAVLVLAGVLPDAAAVRWTVTVAILAALATLLTRVAVDVTDATRDASRDGGAGDRGAR